MVMKTNVPAITTSLMDILHIPYTVLEDNDEIFEGIVEEAVKYCLDNRAPYALVSPKGVMSDPDKPNNVDDTYPLSREEAIEIILDHMPDDTIYSATTGRATRELFFLREKRGESKNCDFLNVGSMGHASSVARGSAMEKPERHVVALDGDSAAMMHMGALPIIGKRSPARLIHVVINNGAHETVGGMPVCSGALNLLKAAEAAGYARIASADSEETLEAVLKEITDIETFGPVFLEIRCACGARSDLGRPTTTPQENRDALMHFVTKS